MKDTGSRAIFALAAVERILGVNADTIAEWERRYNLPDPARSPGGQVLYSRDDVERLRWIGEELAAGREPQTEAYPDNVSDATAERDDDPPGILILLAEHDARAADLEEFFLRTEGYRVVVTFSAYDAQTSYEARRPDLALVELAVSGHAGIDLCRKLRELDDVPIVAISSLDRRDEALAAGAEAFLLKPLDPLLLVSITKDLLRKSAYLRSEART